MLSSNKRLTCVIVSLFIVSAIFAYENREESVHAGFKNYPMPTPVPVYTEETITASPVGVQVDTAESSDQFVSDIENIEPEDPSTSPTPTPTPIPEVSLKLSPAKSKSAVKSKISRGKLEEEKNTFVPLVTELPERKRTVVQSVSGTAITMTEENAAIWLELKDNFNDDDIPEPNLEIGNSICALAAEYLEYPYSNDSTKRFTNCADCSSLAYRVYKEMGLDISYRGNITAAAEARECIKMGWIVSYQYGEGMMAPGDLAFWTTDTPEHEGRFLDIHHVGIYLGEGMFIEASSNEGKVVMRKAWGVENIIVVARPVIPNNSQKTDKKTDKKTETPKSKTKKSS